MGAAQQLDCRNWEEDSYRDAILQERETLSRTVFRTAFAPNPNPNPNSDQIVTASSDGAVASYSISACLEMGCGSSRGRNWLVAEPEFVIRGHDGPAYDVKFYDDSLLLSCGDDGRIRGWKWNEILESEASEQGGKMTPVLDLRSVGCSFSYSGKQCYCSRLSAAGDSCAYCWDMEKGKVKMVLKGHSNYLHCVVSCKLSNQIITGSEDGTARIWDCKSGKCIQVIDPEKEGMKASFPCVSCIALDSSESWLVCGKGQSLSLWNLPARECVSIARTHTSVQDVLFDDNQILAVGAEPSLTRLNMNGDIISQIQCAPASAFSISLHPSGVAAVSGYGALVDMISQFGSHLCTFRCRGV